MFMGECVFMCNVMEIKCLCICVLDKMNSHTAAKKQHWRRSMAAKDQLHVDIRCEVLEEDMSMEYR